MSRTLTVGQAVAKALRKLCEKLATARGNVVTISARSICGDLNPRPCGEALKRLCIKLGDGCFKASKGRYVFYRHAVQSLNICGGDSAHERAV